ncbi:MAG: glycosyltransferase [Planctomycetaceae bacterium]
MVGTPETNTRRTSPSAPVAARRLRRRLRHVLDAVLVTLIRGILCFIPAARRNRNVRRSLWTGSPIISMARQAQAEKLLGVQSESLVYSTYFVTDEFDRDLSGWMRSRWGRHLVPYIVFLWACVRFQRFHFFYNRGLLPQLETSCFNTRELHALQALGKEVFLWTYGSDVRTRKRSEALGRFQICGECPTPRKACICDDELGRRNYETIRKHATAVFAMGDMTEYTPGSRNDLFFWPVDLNADGGRRFAPQYPDPHSERPVRIVHAPNHREFKGTRFFLDAIDRIRNDGVEIDLKLVEKVPNAEALEIYRSADLIFDQCLIGFHGYFAIEAMAMGKPVLTYIRKREYLLSPQECPLQSAGPEDVEAALRRLVSDRTRLHELGLAGRRYVEKYFTLQAFAGRLKAAVSNRKAA